jgi:hypothetical protein
MKASVESATRAKSVFKGDLTALKKGVSEKPELLHCANTKEFVLRKETVTGSENLWNSELRPLMSWQPRAIHDA